MQAVVRMQTSLGWVSAIRLKDIPIYFTYLDLVYSLFLRIPKNFISAMDATKHELVI